MSAQMQAGFPHGAPFLQAEPIVKNTFLEFQVEDSEDEDALFTRCHRRTCTCPCQVGHEEVVIHEEIGCAALPGRPHIVQEDIHVPNNRTEGTRHAASPFRASSRTRMPSMQTYNSFAKGNTIDQKCMSSMCRMPNLNTIVKNTFIDLEDDEVAMMQKRRRAIQTCPHPLSCGEDSPAYVRLPVLPIASSAVPTSPLEVSATPLQMVTSSNVEDPRISFDFKPVVKNTFIELNVDGLDDEDCLLMQTCRRNFKTCPYKLGCPEDMPAYVSLPTSPSSRDSHRNPSSMTDVSASKALDDEDLNLRQSISHLEGNQSVCSATPDMTVPSPAIEASLVHVCEHLLASGGESANEISPGMHNSSSKRRMSKVWGTEERLDCRWPLSSSNMGDADKDVQSAIRQRLQSYGNQYSMSCSQSFHQAISLDSLLHSHTDQLPEHSAVPSDTSFMQSQTAEDEMSLFRNLMHEDRPRSTRQVPPPPQYTAPSAEMLGPASDMMQKQLASDGNVTTASSESAPLANAGKAPQSLSKTVTEMCLLNVSIATDVAACSGHEGGGIEVNNAWMELARKNSRHVLEQQSEAVKPVKPVNDLCSLQHDDCAPAAMLLPETATGLDAAKSLAKKSHCRTHAVRLWCHIYLDTSMLVDGFDVVKKIIGREGCNTKKIYNETSTKVRVRGRGSGHREARSKKEAPVHLMMALAADHCCDEAFKRAFAMAVDLLQDVSRRFATFCRKKHHHVPDGPRFWVGESTAESLARLSDVLGDIPVERLDLEL